LAKDKKDVIDKLLAAIKEKKNAPIL